MFGSDNKDRRTSHNNEVNEQTHGQRKKASEKRGGDWEREGE